MHAFFLADTSKSAAGTADMVKLVAGVAGSVAVLALLVVLCLVLVAVCCKSKGTKLHIRGNECFHYLHSTIHTHTISYCIWS